MIHQLLKTVPGPQRFLPTFHPPSDVGAATGETAHIDLEIYGFPEPRELTLSRLIDSTNLTSSPRHSVKYTAREPPFGFVYVTISDVIDTDFTNYTLTVDNGEGEALAYSFYLHEGELTSGYVLVLFVKDNPKSTHKESVTILYLKTKCAVCVSFISS